MQLYMEAEQVQFSPECKKHALCAHTHSHTQQDMGD